MDDHENSTSNFWDLKSIEFGEGENKKSYRIIMENHNGPCSFITICNIFILRGEMEIPASQMSVSYEYLSQFVAKHTSGRCTNEIVYFALSFKRGIMPLTQNAMYLDPVFTEARSFSDDSGDTAFKYLLSELGIELVHGWLVDPASPEAKAVSRVYDNDGAVTKIARALVQCQFSEKPDEEGLEIADTILKFFDDTRSQLTRYGLSHLASTTKPGTLMALFRNFHISVLYKRDASDNLYSLVTDQSLLNEPSVVWEQIEAIDGGLPTFVDSSFVKSSPAVDLACVEHLRAELQLRVEELQAENLREKKQSEEEEWKKFQVLLAKERLREEQQRRADEECLAEIAEWRQKRKQLLAERQQAEQQLRAEQEQEMQQLSRDYSHAKQLEAQQRQEMQQLAARFDRAEFEVGNIWVQRGVSNEYHISFHARPRQRRQGAQHMVQRQPLTSKYFDCAELEAEGIDITVSREVYHPCPEASAYQARPMLKQRPSQPMSQVKVAQKDDTSTSNGKTPSLRIIAEGFQRLRSHFQ